MCKNRGVTDVHRERPLCVNNHASHVRRMRVAMRPLCAVLNYVQFHPVERRHSSMWEAADTLVRLYINSGSERSRVASRTRGSAPVTRILPYGAWSCTKAAVLHSPIGIDVVACHRRIGVPEPNDGDGDADTRFQRYSPRCLLKLCAARRGTKRCKANSHATRDAICNHYYT